MKTDGLRMHCVYCNATIPVTHILYVREPPDVQAVRLDFELRHDRECGPKSVGMILEIELCKGL